MFMVDRDYLLLTLFFPFFPILTYLSRIGQTVEKPKSTKPNL